MKTRKGKTKTTTIMVTETMMMEIIMVITRIAVGSTLPVAPDSTFMPLPRNVREPMRRES